MSTGSRDVVRRQVMDEWELQRLEEEGKLTASQRRYYREQLSMGQWGQHYRSDQEYEIQNRNRDR